MRFSMMLALVTLGGTTGCAKDEPKPPADVHKGVVFGDPKKQPEPAPVQQVAQGNVPQVKGNAPPKGLVQNVRAAAYRPERLNELKQIGIFFRLYADEHNGRNPQTKEEFFDYIKRDAGGIATAVKDEYYVLNLKVNMRGSGNGVIAYESLQDQGGYQSVRVDGSVNPIPIDELTKLLNP